MIPSGVEIFVGVDPIDLRWSFDRLAGIVAEHIGRDVRSGALFVFFGKHRTALKILFTDGSGLCLFDKRLDKGTFKLPLVAEGARTITIDERTLDALLDGIDIEAAAMKKARARLH
jgi:transposase